MTTTDLREIRRSLLAAVAAVDDAIARAAGDSLWARLHALTRGEPFQARAIATAARHDASLEALLRDAGCSDPVQPSVVGGWLSRRHRNGDVPAGYSLARIDHRYPTPTSWQLFREDLA